MFNLKQSFPFKLPALSSTGPLFQPTTKQWQKDKCVELGIDFIKNIEQQPTFTGSLLTKLILWQTEKIGMDGNCFYRCISKMIPGSEKHYTKLRAKVCRYMVPRGKPIINRYLKTISKEAFRFPTYFHRMAWGISYL